MTKLKSIRKIAIIMIMLGASSACTQLDPDNFRFLQQTRTFPGILTVNTAIDILWVVDNSASMDTSQEKIRTAFAGFANTYMKPSWDIRTAVITTDTYMANATFSGFRSSVVSGTQNWASPHVVSRLGTFVNPTWNPNLVNLTTGKFDNGIKYNEMFPLWNANYAKLIPGIHDGPNTAFCFEPLNYFLQGVTNCAKRDNQVVYNGTSACLSPNAGNSETSINMCINTVENDTVRSGKAIISTKPPTGTPANQAWVDQLVRDFLVNVSVSSAGHGSERGLGSLQQLLADNEASASTTKFFRAGSTRVIIFVSDEEDQTLNYPSPVPGGYNPYSDYKCDQAGLVALNPTANITGVNGYCCSTAGNNCTFRTLGCSAKTVTDTTGTITYTPSICADPAKLVSVASVKSQLDNFFRTLDNAPAGDPNYMIASIVPLTAQTIQSLQTARDAMDTQAGGLHLWAADRGDRYIDLANQVANGSMSVDIGANDYNAILNAIGNAFAAKVGTFVLDRPATSPDDMTITVIYSDGTYHVLSSSDFTVNGTIVSLNVNAVLNYLREGATVSINFQPKA